MQFEVKVLTSTYTNRVVYVFRSYTLKLYSWSRSYSKQPLLWPLLRKIFYTSTFLKFHTHLEQNSARSFQNVFDKCLRVLNLVFSRN